MPRILVVEDEPHLAMGLRFNLEADGHEVSLAADGESALQRLTEASAAFDAVVLDVMLPGKNGFEVARELREHGNYVPILMLTARGRPEDVLHGFDAGVEAMEHVLRAAAGGEHQDRHVVAVLAQLAGDLEAVLAGQHHVEHDGIEGRGGLGQPLQRGLAVGGQGHLVPVCLEVEAQAHGQVRLVLDDQDARHQGLTSRGNSMVKVDPRPSPSLVAKTRPPCCRTTDRTMYSPRPVPLTLDPRHWCRWNRRKIRFSCDWGMPTP